MSDERDFQEEQRTITGKQVRMREEELERQKREAEEEAERQQRAAQGEDVDEDESEE